MTKILFPFLFLFLLLNTLSAQDVFLKKGRYIARETGKEYTGVFREYDADKRLISVAIVKDGLLDDSTTIFYPSGTIKEIRAYKAGQKDGIWKTWDESGKMTAEASFKNGRKDGFWYVWDDQGVKRYEMFYANGEKKGTWIIRDENGKEISREEFK